jgi:hypothetical protein
VRAHELWLMVFSRECQALREAKEDHSYLVQFVIGHSSSVVDIDADTLQARGPLKCKVKKWISADCQIRGCTVTFVDGGATAFQFAATGV